MKIALVIIFSLIIYPLLGTAQNTARFDPIKILWIIKTDKGIVRTHNFLVDGDDVEKIDIPNKPQASKDLGEVISEDLVVYVTLKKNVKIIPLSVLLAKYNIQPNYKNLHIYVYGEEIFYPDDLFSTGQKIKDITKNNDQIHIMVN